MPIRELTGTDDAVFTYDFQNTRPIELMDLTASLRAGSSSGYASKQRRARERFESWLRT